MAFFMGFIKYLRIKGVFKETNNIHGAVLTGVLKYLNYLRVY